MILSGIKNYLISVKSATLWELALRFDSKPSAMQPMLAYWINKGKVRQEEKALNCASTCVRCQPSMNVYYRWLTDE